MGVSCQILFNKPKGGHAPGQAVSGTVKYVVDKPLEVRNVVLSLTGKGRCTWTESRTTNNTTHTTTYSGHEEYYNACINVIEKKNGEETATIPIGAYEVPFEFFLPKNIPPSFKTSSGYITYKILLLFERPGRFKFNKKFTAEVPIRNCIESDEVPVVCGLEKTLTKPFSSKKHVVKVKAEIAKSSLNSGEKASLSIVVTNDTGVNITAIRTELVRYKIFTADCGRKHKTQSVVRGCTVESPSIPKNSVVNLTQEITTLPDMYSVLNSKIISLDFKLRVIVRLPVPHINAYVEIPIVIGEDIEVSVEDGPPSYWEVVCEEEKVKM